MYVLLERVIEEYSACFIDSALRRVCNFGAFIRSYMLITLTNCLILSIPTAVMFPEAMIAVFAIVLVLSLRTSMATLGYRLCILMIVMNVSTPGFIIIQLCYAKTWADFCVASICAVFVLAQYYLYTKCIGGNLHDTHTEVTTMRKEVSAERYGKQTIMDGLSDLCEYTCGNQRHSTIQGCLSELPPEITNNILAYMFDVYPAQQIYIAPSDKSDFCKITIADAQNRRISVTTRTKNRVEEISNTIRLLVRNCDDSDIFFISKGIKYKMPIPAIERLFTTVIEKFTETPWDSLATLR